MRDLIWKLRVLLRLMCSYVAQGFAHWRHEVWEKDPDSYHCCSGRGIVAPCSCMGATVREVYTPMPAPKLCGKRMPDPMGHEFCCRPVGHPGECDSIPF